MVFRKKDPESGLFILDIMDIPDSYRTQYATCIIDNYYPEIQTVKNFQLQHSTILYKILDSIILDAEKDTALQNPLEFCRYKKIINDNQFYILFTKYNNKIITSQVIDILEELLTIDQTSLHHDNWIFVNCEELKKLPQYKQKEKSDV